MPLYRHTVALPENDSNEYNHFDFAKNANFIGVMQSNMHHQAQKNILNAKKPNDNFGHSNKEYGFFNQFHQCS